MEEEDKDASAEPEVVEPVYVKSAKRNMMDHIVAQAARSAIRFNAQLRNQRKSYKRIFRLDTKKRALDRETLSRSQATFLHCGYSSGQQFISSLNSIRPPAQQQEQRGSHQ